MSAWIVDEEHVRVLVWAGKRFASPGHNLSWYYRKNWHYLTPETAPAVGEMLMRTNIASVNFRYDENTPVRYHHRAPRRTTWSVGEILKAVNCYEYQSCEHDGWNRSQAKAFCAALKEHLIREVPGYEAAPWGIDDSSVPAAEKQALTASA